MNTYRIPEFNLDRLTSQLAKLNKRAIKLGSAPILMRQISESFEQSDLGPIRFLEIEISGETPKLNGWEFLASIEHGQLETGERSNVIFARKDTVLPVDYRTCEPICEHCNLSRKRISTFVLRHDNGSLKRVGRNCLADFIRADSHVETLAQMAELLWEALAAAESNEGYGGEGRSSHWRHLDTVLGMASRVVLEYGYISRTKAESTGCASTKEVLIELMKPQSKLPDWKHTAEECKALTEKTRAYISGLTGDTDFDHNLRTIVQRDYVHSKFLGLVAYMPAGYLRYQEKIAREANPIGNFIGTVGERMKLDLEYVSHNAGPVTQWGQKIYFKLKDSAGNLFTWGTNSGCVQEGKYHATFTVKAHREFRGTKETQIERVKLQEIKL